MHGLPSPGEVAVKVMLWLGAPAVIITIWVSFSALVGWAQLSKLVTSKAREGYNHGERIFKTSTTRRQRATVSFVFRSAVFVAVAYSLSQLIGVTFEKIGHSLSIAQSVSVNTGYLVSELLGYQHWSRLSAWTVFGALISIILLNIFDLFGASVFRKFVIFAWAIVLGPGLLLAALFILYSLGFLVVGLVQHNDNQTGMALFYGLWVVCLTILPWMGFTVAEASETIFSP